MPRLIGIVREIAQAEKDVNVDSFFDENGLTKDAVIHSIHFDKKVFKSKIEVAEWLNGKFLYSDDIKEMDGEFISVQVDQSQFTIEGFKTVEVRRGVKVECGNLFIINSPDGYLSLRNPEEIKFDAKAKVKTVIEVARTVDGVHPKYGRVTITKDTLQSFVNNFDAKVFGKDICFDYDHAEEAAAGWLKSLFLSEDGEKLFGEVDWTPQGFENISNRVYKYFSPQFTLNFVKSTTGEEFGPTLTGGGITNKPFLEMEAISLNSKGKTEMETIALSEHKAKLGEVEAKLTVKDSEIVALNARNQALDAENKKLKDEAALSEKKAAFETLLKDGKACEAQREPYMKNDFKAFAEAAVKLNTAGSGSGNGGGSDFQLSEADKEACKKFNLSEDEYCKANKLGKYSV